LARDRFDILTVVAFAVVCVLTVALLVIRSGDDVANARSTNAAQAAEKALRQRAQAALLTETYAPIEALLAEERLGEALLRLEQIDHDLPGEAHTALLRGTILVRQGAMAEGLDAYVQAVQQRPDYVDVRSPLQHRQQIEALVDKVLPDLQRRLKETPDNPTLQRGLRDARYLQSRLAGGCE